MTQLTVRAINAVYDQFQVDPDIAREMAEYFSYEAPGAKHHPAFKKGHWDGRKKLYNVRFNVLPAGLRDAVKAFCKRRGYQLRELDQRSVSDVTIDDVRDFLDRVPIPERFERRDHQLRLIAGAIRHSRRLFLSPTSSGKSLSIYGILRWHNIQSLVVVPTLGLLKQLPQDFVDYGCPPELIHVATTKDPDPPPGARFVVCTWHTAVKQDEEWFARFRLIAGDEVHIFKADSLQYIMERLVDCHLRFGFTGTLDGSKVNEMVLRGSFGPVEKIISTMELVEKGYVARPKIKVIGLSHPEHARGNLYAKAKEIRAKARQERKPGGGMVYATEIETLGNCDARNRFIAKLVSRLDGVTLCLFHREEHGRALLELVQCRTTRPVHFINGGVDVVERDDIRRLIMGSDDAILLASTGTTSTGISIPSIRNVVFASPWKSRIVNLQSIGRGIRMADGKTECEIFDVADDLSWHGEKNHTLSHLEERMKIYKEEGFDVEVIPVELSY